MKLDKITEYVDVQGRSLEDLERMMDAARRGLSIAHRLRDPAEKKKHFSRILGNLNRIRGALVREIKALEQGAGIEVQEVEPEHIDIR